MDSCCCFFTISLSIIYLLILSFSTVYFEYDCIHRRTEKILLGVEGGGGGGAEHNLPE